VLTVENHTEEELEPKEDLKELFTTLLRKVGIDYSPELIESLVSLALSSNLLDEIVSLRHQEVDETAQHSPTHEIINKFLIGINTVKKAMTYANPIGRSAIQLALRFSMVEAG
jgi:uncharacterized protein (UPF0305 family)